MQRFEASACHFPVGECARAHDEEEGASQGLVVMFVWGYPCGLNPCALAKSKMAG